MPTATPGLRKNKQTEQERLDALQKQYQRGALPHDDWLDTLAFRHMDRIYAAQAAASTDLVLTVELPAYEVPVVYAEAEPSSAPALCASTGESRWNAAALLTVTDADYASENLVEAKHRRLVRSQRSDVLDRERKPTASVRDQLQAILRYPPTHALAPGEMDLVWSFRFYLTRFPAGLTKFLKSVVWSDGFEAQQATEVLLPMWAAPELADALELLGPGFRDLRVRAFAVRQLERASDDELALYLLQLVQALKFDEQAWLAAAADDVGMLRTVRVEDGAPRLSEVLCARSSRSILLGTMFYWYVAVECRDERHGALFERIAGSLQDMLEERNAPLAATLAQQRLFVETLAARSFELRTSRDVRPKKIEKLRALLADRRTGMRTFRPPLRLPLDPLVLVSGVVPDASTVFKSNLFPLRLEFRRAADDGEDAGTYTVIVKNGDDLRQDQLVIQLFTLMDRLLRNENLDLKITAYHVLATGVLDGLVQFVPSTSVAAVVAEHGGSLLAYLRHHHPDDASGATFGVQPGVLDTFVRSCGALGIVRH